jgi:hypothetical protein
MEARQAILDCVSNTSSRIALTRTTEADPDPDMLTTLACAVIISATPRRKDEREGMAARVRKRWKALEEMPFRIERIASEIERVNEDGLLAPARQIDGSAQYADVALGRLQELPTSMRLWAEALRERIKTVWRTYDSVFPLRKTRFYWLQSFVVQATGKPHHRQVADLLNAAAVALDEDQTFDALTLAQAWSRRKNKS